MVNISKCTCPVEHKKTKIKQNSFLTTPLLYMPGIITMDLLSFETIL
jgi:hypothetical protein